VPFVASTTSHQRDNARWMAGQNAAIHLEQSELTAERVAGLLQSMSREACLNMAQSAYGCGRRGANDAIAEVLEKIERSTGNA
jgi:UDP-N-acetylglucosamine--N-acetylmuramyl-(pentapeptide) pyrophosphoryl-undecaprenol N-acetylglucosamine transferase